ncbi:MULTISPECIES: hypothetical protein [unclassified Nostoc]|uniref:hypothetical protein n=2 Tax=Nostoc TaxID=1177 RepID=UPI0025F5E4F2|nr:MULTISPECIES: hypothetical protein [unclassified Nostoc]
MSMSQEIDGTKEENVRGRASNKRNSKDSNYRVGGVQEEGRRNEDDQIGSNQSNSSGESLFTQVELLLTRGEIDATKVLDSLRLIKQAHLAYVHAHRGRLEARLNENKENEADFLKACELLEKEVNNLITEDDP